MTEQPPRLNIYLSLILIDRRQIPYDYVLPYGLKLGPLIGC